MLLFSGISPTRRLLALWRLGGLEVGYAWTYSHAQEHNGRVGALGIYFRYRVQSVVLHQWQPDMEPQRRAHAQWG